MANDRVNHPSHYEKGGGHKECIDLLAVMVAGYEGIAAGCIMQAKYLYRAGSKCEASLSQAQKTIEDFKKFRWYLAKFYETATNAIFDSVIFLPLGWACSVDKTEAQINEIVDEFTYDKPELIREDMRALLRLLPKLHKFSEVVDAVKLVDNIIEKLQQNI